MIYKNKNIGWLRLLIGVVFIAFGMPACETNSSEFVSQRPNILLIVSEDNSQDLGCYGNTVVTSPNLDSLARNGAMFYNAYTTYSVCSPSRSSIFTGLYPHQNGQMGLATHKFRMYDFFDNIPKRLKSQGYRTGCLGKLHVNPESAIPFDFHEMQQANFGKNNLRDYAVHASNFIRSGEEPFFLMVNYPDAHFPLIREVEGLPTKVVTGNEVDATLPFTGANTPRLRELTADYYSQINRLDECVGMLLDSLQQIGHSEETLIIYLSDHGAQFSRGKGSNYEGALKIPMIWYWPNKIAPGQIFEHPLVSVIDLFPTLMDLVGDTADLSLPGKSMEPLLLGMDKTFDREYIFAGGALGTAKYFYPRRSVRDARFKLIHNLDAPSPDPYFPVYTDHVYPQVVSGTSREEISELSEDMQQVYQNWEHPPTYELYDLSIDPWEFNNLADQPEYQSELNRLKQVLTEWRKETNDPLAIPELAHKMRTEIDGVNVKHPEHSYQKLESFEWNYPTYINQYFKEKVNK